MAGVLGTNCLEMCGGERVKELNWLPVSSMLSLRDAVLAPTYLADRFATCSGIHSLNTTTSTLLVLKEI